MSVQMSPTKKLSKTISKGDLSASDALKIMQEIGSLDWKQEQERALLALERKNNPVDDDDTVTSPITKEIETESVDEEEFEDADDQEVNESSNGEMTKKQIEREIVRKKDYSHHHLSYHHDSYHHCFYRHHLNHKFDISDFISHQIIMHIDKFIS